MTLLLTEAIALRSNSLRLLNRSPKTITFYETWLNDLARHLLIQELPAITLTDLRYWAGSLIDRQYAVRSRIGAITSIKVFFAWCQREGLLDVDPAVRLEKPERPKQLPQALEDYETLALINCAATTTHPERDVSLLVMMIETGVRVGELVSVLPTQVICTALPDDTGGGWVRVDGKTGERMVPFNKATRITLGNWLAVRPSTLTNLFGLTGWGVRLLLKRLAKKAHIDPKRVHPHVLRHSSVVLRIENGAEAADLMNIYGWSSSAMFSTYAKLANQRLMRRAMITSPTDQLGYKPVSN